MLVLLHKVLLLFLSSSMFLFMSSFVLIFLELFDLLSCCFFHVLSSESSFEVKGRSLFLLFAGVSVDVILDFRME